MIVDVQERLLPVVHEAQAVVRGCEILARAAALLHVPVLCSEHCADRLGPLAPSLRALAGADAIVPKSYFSAADEPAIVQRVAAANRPQIVIAGMEAHVCVLQSAIGFAERGYRAHVVADACGSRDPAARALALERLRAAGIGVVTVEMVLFEWLEHADRPELGAIVALVK